MKITYKIKSFFYFLLNIPANITRILSLFIKIICAYFNNFTDKELASPINDKNENEVLILGNGPSLKEIDFSEIKKNISIACVNYFAIKSELFFRLKPKYYFLLDPVFFWREAKIPVSLRGQIKELFAKLELVDWDIVIVIPQYFNLRLNNKHIKIQKINMNIIYSKENNKFYNYLYSKNLMICGCQNVLVGALYYFILKKIPNIFVAGCDMSEFNCYHVNSDNHVIGNFTHFYESDCVDCTETGIIKLGEFGTYLSYYCKMLLEFKSIKYFSDFQRVNVTNLSLESYIDVFEKKSWKILSNVK